MGVLMDRVASTATLSRAWADVPAADAEDDVLSAGVRRFRDAAEGRITELAATLGSGEFRPDTLTEIDVRKLDGGVQTLWIPTVADRVVERAVLRVPGLDLDALLGPGSFGHRPGLGVADAVREVVRLWGEGFGWALRTDVHDCFPTIPVTVLRRHLAVIVGDPELLRVLDALLERPARRPGGARTVPARRLPQDSSLSPVLSNLVLESVDEPGPAGRVPYRALRRRSVRSGRRPRRRVGGGPGGERGVRGNRVTAGADAQTSKLRTGELRAAAQANHAQPAATAGLRPALQFVLVTQSAPRSNTGATR
ncbi:reverse transcriptase domain-containing protein [Actinosynnema sp. NPDC059797]